jgi:hypothetical protein
MTLINSELSLDFHAGRVRQRPVTELDHWTSQHAARHLLSFCGTAQDSVLCGACSDFGFQLAGLVFSIGFVRVCSTDKNSNQSNRAMCSGLIHLVTVILHNNCNHEGNPAPLPARKQSIPSCSRCSLIRIYFDQLTHRCQIQSVLVNFLVGFRCAVQWRGSCTPWVSCVFLPHHP